MSIRISTGMRNALVGLAGTPHAILVGATGAFVDGGGSNDSITDSGNGFITAGFEIGDWIQCFNATTSANDLLAKLLAVASGTLEFATATVDTAEAFAAATAVVAAKGGSIDDLVKHGVIEIRTGAQPASSDDVESGTLLVTITDDGNAHNTTTGLNGLEFEDDPSSGTLGKLSTQTWLGTPGATGQAGWFRFFDQSHTTGASTTAVRFDGAVALGSGGQMNLASLTITNGVDFVVNTFDLIVPAS